MNKIDYSKYSLLDIEKIYKKVFTISLIFSIILNLIFLSLFLYSLISLFIFIKGSSHISISNLMSYIGDILTSLTGLIFSLIYLFKNVFYLRHKNQTIIKYSYIKERKIAILGIVLYIAGVFLICYMIAILLTFFDGINTKKIITIISLPILSLSSFFIGNIILKFSALVYNRLVIVYENLNEID